MLLPHDDDQPSVDASQPMLGRPALKELQAMLGSVLLELEEHSEA